MILGFKPEFEPKIQSGVKIHSIREDLKDRWKPKMTVHMAVGVRTKHYRCFMVRKLWHVARIEIRYNGCGLDEIIAPDIIIDRYHLKDWEKLVLAKNDGFDSLGDFLQWFNKDFTGKILHWTDFRY